MNKKKGFGGKGIFSTITGFFLIVVIVFGLIAFLAIYTGMVGLSSAVKSDLRSYDAAKQFKDSLLICHGQTRLQASKLDDPGSCPLSPMVKGYRVEQKEVLGCDSNNWPFGDTDDFTHQRIPYSVVVVQGDGSSTCLATLHIYI